MNAYAYCRMHKEQRFCVEKTHLDLQRKENSLQTVTKELQRSKELCASLRRQLEEVSICNHLTSCHMLTMYFLSHAAQLPVPTDD